MAATVIMQRKDDQGARGELDTLVGPIQFGAKHVGRDYPWLCTQPAIALEASA